MIKNEVNDEDVRLQEEKKRKEDNDLVTVLLALYFFDCSLK